MKFAAYALARRMKFRDLDISIETDKGEYRHWYDVGAKKEGKTKMTYPYGYIRRTQGVDGDHVDCYIGPNPDAPNVYVVHQMKAPDFKKYDEDKCMLGFDNADAAKRAYLANFSNDKFFGSMTTMPFDDFKKKALRTMNNPQKLAYDLGSLHAASIFDSRVAHHLEPIKTSASLGDPNYWQGGSAEAPPEGMAAAQPATAEEVVQNLPAGTFQGLQMKLSPDGQRSTTVRVTPDAVSAPEGLQAIFAAEPGAKVEISAQTQTGAGGGGGSGGAPGQPTPGDIQALLAGQKSAAYTRGRAHALKLAYGTYDPELPSEFFGARPGVGANPATVADVGTLRGPQAVAPGARTRTDAASSLANSWLANAQTEVASPPSGMSATTPNRAPASRGETAVTRIEDFSDMPKMPRRAPAASTIADAVPTSGRGLPKGLGSMLRRLSPRARTLGLGLGAGAAGAGVVDALSAQ